MTSIVRGIDLILKLSFILLLSIPSGSLFAQKEGVAYDFSCLETNAISTGVSFFGDLERSMLSTFGVEVSLEEEIAAGKEVFKAIEKTGNIISHPKESDLRKILKELTSGLKEPRGFKYSIHVMDTTELNAFTIGGYIFITTEMLDFCQSDDELACIIGHEISHNELGHINEQLKRIKTAEVTFGSTMGSWAAQTGQIMILSFNQKNEAHCDALGVDLADLADYNGCAASELWQRMSDLDGEKPFAGIFFRSHPYSSDRKTCVLEHLKRNYEHTCE
jgi:predicted Zn-dependent protease